MGELGLLTQYPFRLPKGYVGPDGTLHRQGVMRLATARDEIAPLRDPRVAQNEAYLTVLVLARVLVRLGSIDEVTTDVVEGLFAADLAYLQDLYGIVNFGDPSILETDFPEDDGVDDAAGDDEPVAVRPRASVEEVVSAMEG